MSKLIQAAHLFYDYLIRDENDNVMATEPALSDFSLEIEQGSFVCLLGHNGSGKSTFAKLINAMNLPKEGTVLVAGMDTRNEDSLLDIRMKAGMVFQNPDNQIISNVVEEDVAFGPENIGIPTEEILRRVDEALHKVGMNAYRLKSPNQLSGGQKQRVAIAGIVAMRPECIMLDEPTAMLDPQGRTDVLETVRRLNRERGVTVILITHHMREAALADRVIVMEKGAIRADGKPEDVFSQVEMMHEAGLSVPDTTELLYELRKLGYDLPLTALSSEACAEVLYEFLCGAGKERAEV